MITQVRCDLEQVERVAFTDGLAAAVTALLGPEPEELCAGRGYAALPVGMAAKVGRWRVNDAVWDRVTLTPMAHPFAASAGFELVRVTPEGAPVDGGGGDVSFAAGLAAVRLGVSRRLLDLAIHHLSTRYSDGEPIIRRQMVQGTVADTVAAIDMCRHMAGQVADGGAADHTVGRLHARIGEIDWSIITLFGAAGYIADHPAVELYVSELVSDAWVER